MSNIYFKSNLKHLIRVSGDSQSELAAYLGYSSDSGINNLINPNRGNDYPSDPKLIDDICKRYGITRDMLLYEDLSDINTFHLYECDLGSLIELHKKMFPTITPKDNDPILFKKGYKIHMDFINKAQIDSVENEMMFFEFINLYEQAWNESNSFSALANILSILVYIRSNIQNEHRLEGLKKYKKNIIDKKTLDRDYILNNNNSSLNLEELSEFDDLIIQCISILKKHKDYHEFADYYLAIRYTVNIAHEDIDEAVSASISGYLLSDLVYLQNQYAIDYFVFKDKFINTKIKKPHKLWR